MSVKLSAQRQNQELEKLLNRLKNPNAALDEIGKALVSSVQKRIKETKESPSGVQWQPWSMGTLLGRTKKGTASRGILWDSGNLVNNIQYQIQGKQAVVGVNPAQVPYAGFLQFGTPKMPARPFLGVNQQDMDVIGSILRRHVFQKR